MRRMTGTKDYLCIAGKPSDITANLNKISCLYDFNVLNSAFRDGIVMVIIERLKKNNATCAEECD